MHGIPIRDLPAEDQLPARVRNLTVTARETAKAVSELGGDVKDYQRRDLDEHKELRGEVRTLSAKVDQTNTHLGEMRVTNEKVQGDLRMLVDRNARTDKTEDEKRAESRLSRKNRTAIFVAIAGLVGTLVGIATHATACQPPTPAAPPAASSPAPPSSPAPAPAPATPPGSGAPSK